MLRFFSWTLNLFFQFQLAATSIKRCAHSVGWWKFQLFSLCLIFFSPFRCRRSLDKLRKFRNWLLLLSAKNRCTVPSNQMSMMGPSPVKFWFAPNDFFFLPWRFYWHLHLWTKKNTFDKIFSLILNCWLWVEFLTSESGATGLWTIISDSFITFIWTTQRLQQKFEYYLVKYVSWPLEVRPGKLTTRGPSLGVNQSISGSLCITDKQATWIFL